MRKIKKELARLYFKLTVYANVFRLHEMRFLKRNLRMEGGERVLDVACGIGVFTNGIASRCSRAFGMDISQGNIALAHHFRLDNTAFYIGNAEKLPHPDESFDVVVSICALEHFSDTSRALAEMFRVMRPGARLLLTVDSLSNINDPEFIQFHKTKCLVEKYFDTDSLRGELVASGFEVKAISPILKTSLSACICKNAIRLIEHPVKFNIYSILTYPITLAAELLASQKTQSGIIVGACAVKPKERFDK
ncbi:MAG: class I SAM-dependent methyltransferase [Victivallales bacterium]|nr:class I SAM-dependent methyltransferase [Victivallales bacterium]